MIKQLCRTDPFERIGYQKGGICDIRKHRWFQGFNWEALRNQALVLGSANRFHLEKSYEKIIFLNTQKSICLNLISVAPIIPDIKTSFDTSNFEPITTLDEDSIPEETSNWDQFF